SSRLPERDLKRSPFITDRDTSSEHQLRCKTNCLAITNPIASTNPKWMKDNRLYESLLPPLSCNPVTLFHHLLSRYPLPTHPASPIFSGTRDPFLCFFAV